MLDPVPPPPGFRQGDYDFTQHSSETPKHQIVAKVLEVLQDFTAIQPDEINCSSRQNVIVKSEEIEGRVEVVNLNTAQRGFVPTAILGEPNTPPIPDMLRGVPHSFLVQGARKLFNAFIIVRLLIVKFL